MFTTTLRPQATPRNSDPGTLSPHKSKIGRPRKISKTWTRPESRLPVNTSYVHVSREFPRCSSTLVTGESSGEILRKGVRSANCAPRSSPEADYRENRQGATLTFFMRQKQRDDHARQSPAGSSGAAPDLPQFGQEVARLKGAGKMAFGTQAKPALQNRNSPAQLHAGHAPRIHPKQAYIYYSARVKRLSVRANERDPSLRFVARDGHPSRMAVLARASTTKNRASKKSGGGLQTDRLRLSLRGLYACSRRCYKQRIWCRLTDGYSLNAKDKKVTPRRGNP